MLYLDNPQNKAGGRVLRIAKNKEGGLFDLELTFDGERQTLRQKNYYTED